MKPFWILCNPRSGSSFLCECLNNTKIFPKYDNPKLTVFGHFRVTENGAAFGEWLRLFDDLSEFELFPPAYLKSVYHQHHDLFGELGPDYIKSIIKNIHFLILRRRDIISHIISLYMATYTNKWHIWGKNGVENYQGLFGDINYSILDKCIDDVLLYQNNWDQFLKDIEHCPIYYEDLCDDYDKTMSVIDEFFDLKINSKTIANAKNNNRLLMMRNYYGDITTKCRKYITNAINKR